MPTQSEENKQVIQQRYNALVRGDTDTLFREHAQRRSTGARSPGLAEYDLHRIHEFGNDSCSHLHDRPGMTDFWRNLWLAICI